MQILLVDPSRTSLKVVTRLLEAADHDVRAFTDEVEALECLAQDPSVEALLTSVELGDSMSGLELCWQARLITGDRHPLYILVMSSNYERTQLVEALDSGADDFISKPLVPEELYARLRAAARVTGMQRELMRLASTDPLTGAFNRRAFFRAAERMCLEADRGVPVSAIMMDVDHFKRINDEYGHDAGDAALCGVAAELASVERAVLGRLGGEEFALVLENRTGAEAELVAEALRIRIAAISFPTARGQVFLTSSFGVASCRPGEDIDTLLKRADLALYEAKSGGRNRVVVATAAGPCAQEHPGGVIRATRTGAARTAAE